MMVLFFPFLLLMMHLFCGFITTMAQSGAPLGGFKTRIERKMIGGSLPKLVAYPLIVCETCISWTWGSLAYWLVGSLLLQVHWIVLLKWWLPAIAGCAYLNFRAWTKIYADQSTCNVNHRTITKLDQEAGIRSGPN